jgi:hypothetical protein
MPTGKVALQEARAANSPAGPATRIPPTRGESTLQPSAVTQVPRRSTPASATHRATEGAMNEKESPPS